jgi:hypothetical protein
MSVTSIAGRHPGVQALAAANAKSPILFPVASRPLDMVGNSGATSRVETHKAIARVGADGKPICLGVVGKDYSVVKNKNILPNVERELLKNIPGDRWENLEIKDSLSYDGGFTQREYLFKGFQSLVTTESGFETQAALSFLFRNSYDGSSSVFFGGSVVDLICINGMIGTRWSENISKRHTGAAPEYPYETIVAQAITRYQAEVAELTKLGHHSLKGRYEDVRDFLAEVFSDRRAARMFRQYGHEAHFRGENAFALLSALTFYSSHGTVDSFPIRRTGNDNVAAALAKRQDEIGELIHGPRWTAFLAAA